MAWSPVNERPFRSQHLGERHLAELRVSPEAQPAYAALVPESSFGVGTLIVESLLDEKTGERGPVLALERTETEWRYWVLGPKGHVDSADSSAACARCHAAAPAAPLFGLQRAALDAPPSAATPVGSPGTTPVPGTPSVPPTPPPAAAPSPPR
jgi:hypothetical protein